MNKAIISYTELHALLRQKVVEVLHEPDYNWNSPFRSYMSDEDGLPLVRLGIINFELDTDIWAGLRSPALVGMYPVTPEDIWRHYSCLTSKNVREDGSNSPLVMPESFDAAKQRYRRGILVCGMLAVNLEMYRQYASRIRAGEAAPFDYYSRATADVAKIINKAIGKVGMSLMSSGRAAVAMTDRNTDMVIERTRSEYYSGRYHGPCNNHWPNNSVAVMTGLLRFGIHRIPFRDEVTAQGKRQRLFGRYRSIMIFDEDPPISADGITLYDSARRESLQNINDYTVVTDTVLAQRYCPYNTTRADEESICGKCLEVCPSGAIPNSSPTPAGFYPERLLQQQHRFSDGKLDFDYGNCTNDRHKKAELYEDYVCGRCEVICASEGVMKSASDIMRIDKSSSEGYSLAAD